MSVLGDEVVLSKPVYQCVFCHSERDLRTFRDKAICASCARSVGTLREESTLDGLDETTRDAPLPARSDPAQAERAAAAGHEGRLRVVRSSGDTLLTHEELPASTTAW